MSLRFSLSTKRLKLSDVETVSSVTVPSVSVSMSHIAAATAVMARMVASGIWFNANPKDKALTETVGLVDQLAAHLAKIETDVADLSDVATIAVSAGFIDAANLLDSAAMSVGLSVVDSVALTESLAFFIQSALQDPVTLQDHHTFALLSSAADSTAVVDQAHSMFGKQLTDTTSVLDNLERAGQFQRAFADIVSIDDFSQVDKQWSGTKQNVAFTSDLSLFGLSKAALDSALIGDAYSYAASKGLTDSVGSVDVISIQLNSVSTPVFSGFTFNSSTFG